MTPDQGSDTSTDPKRGYIPKPPTKADIDQVSTEQGMITDEWGSPASDNAQPADGTPG